MSGDLGLQLRRGYRSECKLKVQLMDDADRSPLYKTGLSPIAIEEYNEEILKEGMCIREALPIRSVV